MSESGGMLPVPILVLALSLQGVTITDARPPMAVAPAALPIGAATQGGDALSFADDDLMPVGLSTMELAAMARGRMGGDANHMLDI